MSEETERLQAMLDNVIRINKERANKDRNLRPVKEHNGYILLSRQQKTHVYETGGTVKRVPAWESVLQTPYGYQYDDPESLIRRDLFDKDVAEHYGLDMYSDRGVSAAYNRYDEMYKRNVVINLRLKNVTAQDYWMVILTHTKPISMRPETNDKTNK